MKFNRQYLEEVNPHVKSLIEIRWVAVEIKRADKRTDITVTRSFYELLEMSHSTRRSETSTNLCFHHF